MLQQILHEIERATGPITVQELSQRLQLEPGVVAELVAFWVRKGRLVSGASGGTPPVKHCGDDCQGPSTCHFVARLPDGYGMRG